MYTSGRLTLLLALVAVASVALVVPASLDLHTFLTRPHPFISHGTAMPAIAEPPWSPAVGLDMNALPWVLDPVEGWTTKEREVAAAPCGRLDLLRERYPVWATSSRVDGDFVGLCSGADSVEERTERLQSVGVGRGKSRYGDTS